MYKCLKVLEVKRDNKPSYYVTKFLDGSRCDVFKVYTKTYPPFSIGSEYDLDFAPSFDSFNFLRDDE
jgi:hypothetical protein